LLGELLLQRNFRGVLSTGTLITLWIIAEAAVAVVAKAATILSPPLPTLMLLNTPSASMTAAT
jgi:hypothetical protein